MYLKRKTNNFKIRPCLNLAKAARPILADLADLACLLTSLKKSDRILQKKVLKNICWNRFFNSLKVEVSYVN
jgi:hypothetical protein